MIRIVSIAQIRSIVAVDRFGTVTAAAQALGLSVSAVSNHLNTVERKLGVTLFNRREGRFVATPHGSAFLRLGESAIRLVDQMLDLGASEAHHRQEGTRG
ncbi:LysR family transcriptional regulator [Promicromonospora sp. NPDC057488]|uniref:LysR family transcriptional regulator n=1 Tax=Promicromonospora sp. NPDC057488 TaxID=3346147 RepID=UPI00366C53BB